MTTIRTTCSRCGDVELTTGDVGLELLEHRGEGHYRFDCPTCGCTQRRPASHRVVSILLATGVAFEIVQPQITEAEIEQFVARLDNEDWLNELLASD